MNDAKRKALEAAGFRIGDTAEFLGLSDEECRLVALRLAVSRALRSRREGKRLTQQQLAVRLKSSQSRIAKMESGSPDVSLDLLFRGFFAVGGELSDIVGVGSSRRGKTRSKVAIH